MSAVADNLDRMTSDAAETYRETVQAVSSGDAVPSDLFETLAASSKTLDEFKADVQRAAERRQAVADLDRAAVLDAEHLDARRAYADAHAAATEAEKLAKAEYDANLIAIREPVETLKRHADRLQRQSRELHQTAQETLRRTADPLHVAATEQRIAALTERRSRILGDVAKWSMRPPSPPRNTTQAERDRFETETVAHGKAVAAADKEAATLGAEIAALRAAQYSS